MSRLNIFWPEDQHSVATRTEERMILPFPRQRNQHQHHHHAAPMDVITRARVLYANRQCHDCGYPVVEPIELPDSMLNRTGMTIPGTATIVGFRCCGCQNEWSI